MRKKRILIALACLAGLIVGLWKWRDSQVRAARRLAAWEARQQEQAAGNVPLWEQTEIYPVVYPIPQPDIGPVDEEAWIESIRRVGPTWSYRNGSSVHAEAVPGAIVVAQTAEVHKAIRGAIERLSTLQNRPATWMPVPLFPATDPQKDQVSAALDELAAIQCVEMPLVEVASHLSKRHGVPIRILPKKLEEAGIPPDTPITLQLDGVTLRSLLQTLLDELELSFLVRDEGLLITTPEDAESQLILVAYPVYDFLAPGDLHKADDALTDLLESTIAPESWERVGGTGSQHRIFGGWLVVSQTQDVQEDLGEFLQQLRSALRNTGDQMAFPMRPRSATEERARAALGHVRRFKFYETPLHNVVEFLSADITPILLNAKRLEESGVMIDVPITCDLPPAPLATQLNLVLEPLGLTYVIRDEMLQITTLEDAEEQLETRFYDVRPLIHSDLGAYTGPELEELVTSLIEPNSWDWSGGRGSVELFRGMWAVSHVPKIHSRIERLLRTLELQGRAGISLPAIVWIDHSESGPQLDEKLRTIVDVDYCGVPVRRILEDLAAKHDLPFWIDEAEVSTAWPRLQSAIGFPARIDAPVEGDFPNVLDAPVTLCEKEISIGGALARVLRPCGLYALPLGHVLWVTVDRHPATWNREVRLYDLEKLRPADKNPRAILDTIRARQIVPISQPTVRPYSQPVDGVRLMAGNWLAVSATPDNHAVLEDWLTEQRTGTKPRRAAEREELQRELESWDAIERDFEAAELERGAVEESRP